MCSTLGFADKYAWRMHLATPCQMFCKSFCSFELRTIASATGLGCLPPQLQLSLKFLKIRRKMFSNQKGGTHVVTWLSESRSQC